MLSRKIDKFIEITHTSDVSLEVPNVNVSEELSPKSLTEKCPMSCKLQNVDLIKSTF